MGSGKDERKGYTCQRGAKSEKAKYNEGKKRREKGGTPMWALTTAKQTKPREGCRLAGRGA